MPDFFLIADSQSPGLQSLPELHRLTQDRSGDPKVLRKAEIVYSEYCNQVNSPWSVKMQFFRPAVHHNRGPLCTDE